MHSSSGANVPRPSFQSSLRSSFDTTGFGGKPRTLGDKAVITEWHPPTQSMMASQLMEVDQLSGLTAYVSHVETELSNHNELKHAIELVVSLHPYQKNAPITSIVWVVVVVGDAQCRRDGLLKSMS